MNTFHTSLQLHCCIMCCIALLSSKQQQKTSSYRCVYNALILQAFIDRSRTLIEAETTSVAAAECTFGYSFCFFAALFSFLAVPCSPDAQHTQLHLSMLHGSKNRTSTTWTWTTTQQKKQQPDSALLVSTTRYCKIRPLRALTSHTQDGRNSKSCPRDVHIVASLRTSRGPEGSTQPETNRFRRFW